MGLIELCIVLAFVGVLLYLFNVYVTVVDAKVKQIINWVVIAALILIVLYAFGVLPLHDVAIPRVVR